jgi:hypothetical protein
MGYSTYTTLIYGFELNNEQAKKLDEVILDAAKFIEPDQEIGMEDAFYILKLDNIGFKGDQADGRVQNTTGYEDRYPIDFYGFGVDLGDDNMNNIKVIAKGPTPEMLATLESVKPYLKAASIKLNEPSFHLISQTL